MGYMKIVNVGLEEGWLAVCQNYILIHFSTNLPLFSTHLPLREPNILRKVRVSLGLGQG